MSTEVQGPEVFLKTRGYPDRTLGTLTVKLDGVQVYSCKSLELPWRANRNGESCIPVGVYPMVKEFSPAFAMDLWELKHVPGRTECKIHAANFPHQLKGCIAPALRFADIDGDGKQDASSSRKALEGFMLAMGGATVSHITIETMDGQRVLAAGMNGFQ